MTDSFSRKRLTIGVILDNVAGESRSSLWPGIADTIQAHGSNLLCFTGGYLHDPHDFTLRGNIIYEMIDRHALDGLIIWTSSLSSYVGHESIEKFCARYRPLPMVSIGVILENTPSIVLDSYQGMCDMVSHLITVHHRQRIAFIRGPAGHRDAEERYRAYCDVLQEHHLPFVPELVSPPFKWFDPGGQVLMSRLLDEHPTHFDAVVGVNDGVAVEAMQILQARGIRVPEDVSIVGFNNTPLSRVVTPPLTTVPWRMYERGHQAAKLILAMITGEPVPDRVLLRANLVVRQSCGCIDPAVVQARVELSRAEQPSPIAARDYREQWLAILEQTIEEKERYPESVAQFLDTFLDALEGKPTDVFLPTLEKILRRVSALGGDASAWQMAVSALRRQILPMLLSNPQMMIRAEDLWHQARLMIGESAQRTRVYQEWFAGQRSDRLRKINQGLATRTSLAELMNILADELPRLGIMRCYLALYEDPAQPTGWCRLRLAFDENGRQDLGTQGRRILARDLAMGSELPTDLPYQMLVAPLYFQDEQLGLVMFTQLSVGDMYEVLRDEISMTLKGVMLAEENDRLYHQALEAQRTAQEGRQLAEQADRLKSSFLSMVSHELLTPLVLLVGLSEMMLHEGSGNHPPLPEPYRSDLTRIHLSAQQLGNLIRDVLDLTRSEVGQLKLTQTPLNLGEVLRSVILVGEQMARGKDLDWRVEIPETLPMVYGDASRLQQVALNLISNAVKFTSQGYIKLQVTVNFDEVTILIHDTGLGVPKPDQEAIFDQFRQSERTIARGYGGLGIGLAICQQLVELHGGHIGVHSSGDENGGSIFYFTLPVMSEQNPERMLAHPDSGSVLLLTEQANDDARLQEYLEREGFLTKSLCIAGNADWMTQVLEFKPSAVLLNFQPNSDASAQLTETLKSNLLTQDVPVLFYALDDTNAGAMLAVDCLSKPLGANVLAQTLQRYGLADAKCEEKQSVLVVDDDPNILEMHTRIVQTFLPECSVRPASNGRIALDLMQRETPSLVLLDLMMPELDGMGVLAAMQENEKLRGVPVIVLTAQVLTHAELANLNRNIAAVLQKGLFTTDETFAHIKQTLARNKRLGSESRRMVAQVVAFIHECYAESISREDMASRVGVSARHLTRCFHQEMGISPITYLNRYRVKKAKQLLDAGDQNITEIATAVGFSSSNYFTDAFRRETGISPRDYQRRR
jgi:signal transduction histidine kinase/DNA-binding LacI/PurR family transcriptional regulator/AraC-like DNA-binding protein